MDLIRALEGAKTKDELEDLGIEYLSVDVDKRKTKEVIRAELLAEAEKLQPEAPRTAAEKPVVTSKSNTGARMARNVNTGRVMPWTAAMAKFSHMEEV
jgi:hypothetical protein